MRLAARGPKLRTAVPMIVLAGLVAAAGCSRRETGNVSGKVTYKGKSLASGSVIFTTPDAPAVPANINPDGTYTCKDVLEGQAVVAVISPNDASEARETAAQKPGIQMEAAKFDPKKWFPIPAKYGQNSPLTFQVKPGDNTFDIDLHN